EPIGVEQNRDRVLALMESLKGAYRQAEADVGLRQFLLHEGENSLQQATVYVMFATETEKDRQIKLMGTLLKENYPDASVDIRDAPNAFDQLFSADIPYYEVRWKELETKKPVEEAKMDEWLSELPVQNWERGPGLQKESSVVFRINLEKLALYGINAGQLQEKTEQLFGRFTVDEIKRFGEITPIRLKEGNTVFEEVLRENYLRGMDNNRYAIGNFVNFSYDNHYKYVTADRGGIYQS